MAPLRHRPLVILVLVGLLAVTLLPLPGAAAAAFRVNDPLPLEGVLEVPQSGGDLQDDFFLLAAALDVTGRTTGPIVAMGTEDDTRFVAGHISVWDMQDPRALAEDRPVQRVEVGTLRPDQGATFFWGVGDVRVEGHDGFSLSLFFDLLGSLPDMGPADPRGAGPYPPTLVSSMSEEPWSLETASDNRTFYLPLGTGFTVQAPNGTTEHYAGERWMATLHGAQEVDVRARALAVPLAGSARLDYAPGTEAAFDAGFSMERIGRFIDTLAAFGEVSDDQAPADGLHEDGARPDRAHAGSATGARSLVARQPSGDGNGQDEDAGQNITTEGPPPEALFGGLDLDRIKDMGALANGILMGRITGDLSVAGESVTEPGPSLVRFEVLTFDSFSSGTAHFSGAGALVFTEGTVVSGEGAPTLGFLGVPVLAWALYLIALGAWLGSRYWSWRDRDEALSHTLQPWALGALLVGTLASFLLFDREIAFILGTSIIDQIGHSMAYTGAPIAATAGTFGLVVLIQLAFWGIVMGLIGFPVRIIARSVLKVSGLTRVTYGFASALGALCAWGLGSAYILPYLGRIAGQVVGGL